MLSLILATRLLLLGVLLTAILSVAKPPSVRGDVAHAFPLVDSLLARLPWADALVRESGAGSARLELRADLGLRIGAPLVLETAPSSPGDTRLRYRGEWDVTALHEGGRFEIRRTPGEVPFELQAGESVRVRLARQVVALALDTTGTVSGPIQQALLQDLTTRLAGPLIEIIPFPALADTTEALQEARRVGANQYGWLRTVAAGEDYAVELQLFSAKDGAPQPPLRARVPGRAVSATAVGKMDPAALLPGCRPAGRHAASADPALDAVPRRFRRDVVDVIHADRIDSWRMADDEPALWQSYPFGEIWPPRVATRWPVATMLPLNSYFALDRSETRVTYTLCSNQRPRYLLVSTAKGQPDSLGLAISDGPLDTLKTCTADCFGQVNRVDPAPGFHSPPGLPRTAGVRIALGRVDLGPSGQPVFDAQGFVKTRKSAVIYHDAPTATLWLSSADTAFQVPGRFGSKIETYRVGRAGPPGFLVTSAAPVGQPDWLEFWVWEDGRLDRRWRSEPFPGSITALYAGDLDGDAREDVWLACHDRSAATPRTVIHYYRAAAPARGGRP